MNLLDLYPTDDLQLDFSRKWNEQSRFLESNLQSLAQQAEQKKPLRETEQELKTREQQAEALDVRINFLMQFKAWLASNQPNGARDDNAVVLYRLMQMANFLSQLSIRSKLFQDSISILDKYQNAIKSQSIATLLEVPTMDAEHHLLFSISPALDDLRTAVPLKYEATPNDEALTQVVADFNQNKMVQYKAGLKLASYLYTKPTTVKKDYDLLANTLQDSRQYIERPSLANDSNFTKKLKNHAKSIDGKPVAWQKYLGAFLMVVGVTVMVLGVVGIPWTVGGSAALGIKIGYSLLSFGTFIAGGTLAYLGGQDPDSMSATVSQLEKTGAKAAKILAKL